MMTEADELREMSRSLAEIAMTAELSDKRLTDFHRLYNKLELVADELEGKKQAPLLRGRKDMYDE